MARIEKTKPLVEKISSKGMWASFKKLKKQGDDAMEGTLIIVLVLIIIAVILENKTPRI